MKHVLLLAALLPLGGCAAISGYETAAVGHLRDAEDVNIRTWATNACATPFSAAIRHPEIVPALRDLCLPAGSASSPATLLDNVPNAH